MSSSKHDITIALIFARFMANRRLLLITIVAVIVAVSFVMYSIPDYFRSDEIVGYEERTSVVADGLQAMGIEHGFDMGLRSSNWDAIFPIHYSFLFKSDEFLHRVMQIQIVTSEGDRMSYFTYLKTHPQKSWWLDMVDEMKGWFTSSAEEDIYDVNPNQMTDAEQQVFENARKKVLCSANIQKNIVMFSVLDQDPYICAQMVDSVRVCLQQFMSNYRKNKMKRQKAFYGQAVEKARLNYEASLQIYNQYVNSHTDVQLSSVQLVTNRLHLDVMQKKTILDAIDMHYQSTFALLQENIPVFDMIQNAGIPTKAAGPKRIVNVSIAVILAFVFMMLFLMRKDLFYHLRQ